MNLPTSKTYRFSLFCGALPLVIGLIIFISWLATGWRWLEKAGFYTLFGGLVFFVAGIMALLIWFVRTNQSGLPRRHGTIVSAGVLLANFPVAAVIIWSVLAIESTYYLTIKNNSTVLLSEVHFFGQGYDLNIGKIPPGEKLKLKLHPAVSGESSLILHGNCGNNSFTNIVEGYFEAGNGGKAVVTVGADRKIGVENPE